MDALDNGQYACGVFIDLQKAFDTVDHEILLKKLFQVSVAFLLIYSAPVCLVGNSLYQLMDLNPVTDLLDMVSHKHSY